MQKFYLSPTVCQLHKGLNPELGDRWLVLDKVLKETALVELKVEPHKLRDDILAVIHSSRYIKKVIKTTTFGGGAVGGTPFNAASLEAAYAGIDSVLMAVDNSLLSLSNFTFVNIRPPGHHAGYESSSGFCIFNNVTAAAQYATSIGYQSVVILDWDVHSGNGTSQCINSHCDGKNKCINFFNIYQHDAWPLWKGHSYDRNYQFPLLGGITLEKYLDTFQQVLSAIAAIKPDLIIISCGFDSCYSDAGLLDVNFPLLPQTYGQMTQQLLTICPKIISVLEGGYNLNSIGLCLKSHIP